MVKLSQVLRELKEKEESEKPVNLKGDKCPKLFGKWKPLKFNSFSIGGGLEHHYEFDFAIVEIHASNIYYPRYNISAHTISPFNQDLNMLFEPRILEIYHDAKEFMKESIKNDNRFNGINIEEHSNFGRRTGFVSSVDYKKVNGGFNNIQERNKVVKEIYESLENEIRKEFGILKEELQPHYLLWIRAGDEKVLQIAPETYLITENPLEDKTNAGTLYMYVISREKGEKDLHINLVNFCTNYLNKQKDKMDVFNERVAHTGCLKGDGSGWVIDLSHVELPSALKGDMFKALGAAS